MTGNKIKEYRKEKGWTQGELAEKTGLSKISIGNYERGFRYPTLKILEKISNAFEVPVNCLLDGISYKESENREVVNAKRDSFFIYLQYLNCDIRPANENGESGYLIDLINDSSSIFINYETLDRVEAMIEADIKKLLATFGRVK